MWSIRYCSKRASAIGNRAKVASGYFTAAGASPTDDIRRLCADTAESALRWTPITTTGARHERNPRRAGNGHRRTAPLGVRATRGGEPRLGDLTQTVGAQHHLVQALSITQPQHGELLRNQSEAIEQLKREHGAKLDQIIGLLGQLLDQDETKPE